MKRTVKTNGHANTNDNGQSIDRLCPKSDPWYSKFEEKVDKLIGNLENHGTRKTATPE